MTNPKRYTVWYRNHNPPKYFAEANISRLFNAKRFARDIVMDNGGKGDCRWHQKETDWELYQRDAFGWFLVATVRPHVPDFTTVVEPADAMPRDGSLDAPVV